MFTNNAWADTYTWNLAEGDLGTTGSPSSSVTKGSPSITWSASYTWGGSTATKYFGNDATKGVQVGSGSSTNKCSTMILSTSGISGTITNVTVNGCHASNGGASIVIKVGGTTVKTSTNFTTSNANYSTGTISQSGTIEITISNSKAKAFYVKSISITYSGGGGGGSTNYTVV